MCLSNDCYIRVINSLMTVLLEYINLNEYSLLKMFFRFKFSESNSNIRFSPNYSTVYPEILRYVIFTVDQVSVKI